MKRLIKDGEIVDDGWLWLDAAASVLPAGATEPPLLLPLGLWQAAWQQGAAAGQRLGVWLGPDDDPAAVLPALPELPLIAVHFSVFTDGRGYSQARLLRRRYGFGGELRACGDVLRDQMYFLQQCGFNAFSLRADQDPVAALAALRDYSWSPLAGLAEGRG